MLNDGSSGDGGMTSEDWSEQKQEQTYVAARRQLSAAAGQLVQFCEQLTTPTFVPLAIPQAGGGVHADART